MHLLFFLAVFSCCASSSKVDNLFGNLEMEDCETFVEDDLVSSILFVFPSVTYNCITIVGEKSSCERYNSVVQSRIPSVLMSSSDDSAVKHCKAVLLLVDNVQDLTLLLKRLGSRASDRYYCLIQNATLQEMRFMRWDEMRLFKDSEAVLFRHGEFEKGLQFNPQTRKMENFTVSTIGSWEMNNAFKPGEIRFSTGNCDIHSRVLRNGTDLASKLGITSRIPVEFSYRWYDSPRIHDFNGVDWIVFSEIAQLMNCEVRYVAPLNNTLLGDLDENSTSTATWKGGIMGNLVNDLADVAFCGLWVEWRKFRAGLKMSKPFQKVCIIYAVPKPTLANDWLFAFSSFYPLVYVGVFVSTIAVGSFTFFINKYDSIFVMSKIQDFKSWSFCVLTAWGIILHANTPQSSPRLGSIRRVIVVWALFAVIIDSSFSTLLISKLTLLPYERKPENVKDLVDSGYEGPHIVPYPFEAILPVKERYSDEWIKKTFFENDFDIYLERLRTQPKQTILGTMYDKNTFVPASPLPIPDDILARYEPMDECVAEVYEGYALRPGSRFNDEFDRLLTLYKEFGFIDREMSKELQHLSKHQPTLRQMTEPRSSRATQLQPLSVRQLSGLFFLLLMGLGLAFVVFLIEVYSYRLNHSLNDLALIRSHLELDESYTGHNLYQN